ncbi:unnamed protein product [Mytilus edulis]|uniref:Uncharacterized protein n=1 Tax=Mytilus edulis TaxID=6550 RepID=A0A8S3RS35_MYTED|nr:unnamed protein product [Mytilus edulis]
MDSCNIHLEVIEEISQLRQQSTVDDLVTIVLVLPDQKEIRKTVSKQTKSETLHLYVEATTEIVSAKLIYCGQVLGRQQQPLASFGITGSCRMNVEEAVLEVIDMLLMKTEVGQLFSRKIIWLCASITNKRPEVVADFFLKAADNIKAFPSKIRCDPGTENGLAAAIQLTHTSDKKCNCGHCGVMPSAKECVCCCEISKIVDVKNEHPDTACITDHPGFHPVCLDIHVLNVAYYQYRQQYGEHPDHGNEGVTYIHLKSPAGKTGSSAWKTFTMSFAEYCDLVRMVNVEELTELCEQFQKQNRVQMKEEEAALRLLEEKSREPPRKRVRKVPARAFPIEDSSSHTD